MQQIRWCFVRLNRCIPKVDTVNSCDKRLVLFKGEQCAIFNRWQNFFKLSPNQGRAFLIGLFILLKYVAFVLQFVYCMFRLLCVLNYPYDMDVECSRHQLQIIIVVIENNTCVNIAVFWTWLTQYSPGFYNKQIIR